MTTAVIWVASVMVVAVVGVVLALVWGCVRMSSEAEREDTWPSEAERARRARLEAWRRTRRPNYWRMKSRKDDDGPRAA